MEAIAAVEDIEQADSFLYDIDLVGGSMIGELARRGVGKHSIVVRLLRYSCHICHVLNINALLKAYRCPSCDQFIKMAQHLEQHLTTCKERVKHVFPRKVYELRETLFDNLDSFNIPHSDDQKLFKNKAKFHFESIYKQLVEFRDTDT